MVQWFVIFPVLSLGSGGPGAFSLVGEFRLHGVAI